MANPAIARSLQSPGMNQEQEDFAARLILIETEARLVLLVRGLQLAQQDLGIHRFHQVLVETGGKRAQAMPRAAGIP